MNKMQKIQVTAQAGLKLRDGPGLAYRMLGVVPPGGVLAPVEPDGQPETPGWLRVEYQNRIGYVAAEYTEPWTEPIRFEAVAIAAGFDPPVGTAAERAGAKVWPGEWVDANPYGNFYQLRPNVWAVHTGADLNLNAPHWDADKGSGVYSVAAGIVATADHFRHWGGLVVVAHHLGAGRVVYSRYGHLKTIQVAAGEELERGRELGTIGGEQVGLANHLHFDIADHVLAERPTDWPGRDRARFREHYFDPLRFISERRPERPELAGL